MPFVTFGSNLASLNAQRQLGQSTAAIQKSFQRLSSGFRINSASDDPAGLSISSDLKVSHRVFNQGVRNFNDGLGLLNVADGSLDQLSNIVIRLKELAEQSANGVYGTKQRKALDAEAQALAKEYFRIERGTSFNGQSVFGAEFGQLRLQGGYGLNGGIQASLGGAISNGSFANPVTQDNDTTVHSGLSLVDLNADGILDLVSGGDIGFGAASVSIGNGDGSFKMATSYAAGGTGQITIAGDINGDGFLDLVSGSQQEVVYRFGNGDGTFGALITLPLQGDANRNVDIVDVNNDGIMDLAILDGLTEIHLGLGGGRFSTAAAYFDGLGPGSGSSPAQDFQDLNGDGNLDLIQTTDDGVQALFGVAFGNGNGTFRAFATYTSNGAADTDIGFADLNGDGILDAVSAGYSGSSGAITVRLGRANGTFAPTSTSYLMNDAFVATLELQDMNGDGFVDAITGGGEGGGNGNVAIRYGRGDGTFGAITSYIVNTDGAYQIAIGDLNGDGVLDIAAGGTASSFTTQLANTTSGISPLLPFKLTTRADALQALPQFDKALTRLSIQRGRVGAFQSRIASAISTLQVNAENFLTAASRITDVDVADESAELARKRIAQQAAIGVLAQANQQPQMALALINGAAR